MSRIHAATGCGAIQRKRQFISTRGAILGAVSVKTGAAPLETYHQPQPQAPDSVIKE
ncbi:MAG: hypothetical protein ACFUZC_23415 [Chthoniobacteraceae bacterium]